MKKLLMMGAAILAGATLSLPAANADNHQEAGMEAPAMGPAGVYTEDDAHAYIMMTYVHQGFSSPYLRYNDFSVTLDYDPAALEESSVEVVIQADSIDSGVAEFDNHLNSADFFETETYPEITFVSTSLEKTGEMTGTMTGDLTIKDITKPVTLDVTLNQAGEGMDGSPKLGFSAKGTIKRSDFDVDMYVPYVSDDVELIIEIELVKTEA